MYNISYKYKRLLFLIFKLIIVGVAFYFIHHKLSNNELLTVKKLKEQFNIVFSNNIWALIGVLLFTDANWFLEVFKWKALVSTIKNITFFEAFEQSFSSLTISLITPNRIGEYGAKAIFFEKQFQKKIVGLNFVGNTAQLCTTILFGIIGVSYFFLNFKINLPKLNLQYVLIFSGIIALLFLFRKQFRFLKIKKHLEKFYTFLKGLPNSIYSKTLLFSIARYLVFSHQFYFLLCLFGVETAYFILISIIFCMYFFASFIPSLSIFDWAIKGSIAVWLFSFIGLNELTIITVTTFMWILNFAIPAIFGSLFVLNFKTPNYK